MKHVRVEKKVEWRSDIGKKKHGGKERPHKTRKNKKRTQNIIIKTKWSRYWICETGKDAIVRSEAVHLFFYFFFSFCSCLDKYEKQHQSPPSKHWSALDRGARVSRPRWGSTASAVRRQHRRGTNGAVGTTRGSPERHRGRGLLCDSRGDIVEEDQCHRDIVHRSFFDGIIRKFRAAVV